MSVLTIDFEARGVVDLPSVGAYNYAQHPQTQVTMLGWKFDDEPAQLWLPGRGLFPPDRIIDHVAAGGEVVAHNAPFEFLVWNYNLARARPSLPLLKLEQLVCTQARAYAMALPGSLADVCAALHIGDGKDKEGHLLMLRTCSPTNKKMMAANPQVPPVYVTDQPSFVFMKERRTPQWAWKRLGEYCLRDVDAEREVYKRTLPLSRTERAIWVADQRINSRGVLFQESAVAGALLVKERAVTLLNERMASVTGGAVQACSALPALKQWLLTHKVKAESLDKDAIKAMLDHPKLPAVVREALGLRRESGRNTSVAKLLKVAELAAADGRVRYIFQYHGAATGRWAGRGVQPHNFPRDLPKPAEAERIMALIEGGDPVLIELEEGPALTVISQMLRAFMVPAPGNKFMGGDWANVEGRGVAWLAGQDDKLDAFRECDADPELPDMYERAYAGSFNRPATEVTEEERQYGKVQELAFGYQGGVGAYRNMGKDKVAHLTDETIDDFKKAWRAAYPMIEQYWHAIDRASIRAVLEPGKTTSTADVENRRKNWDGTYRFEGLPLPPRDRAVKFRVCKPGPFLYALLPSGRVLTYPYPELRDGKYGPYLTYMTRPQPKDWTEGRVEKDEYNTRAWARLSTYGGKLTENVTQAICRDFLGQAILDSEAAGYYPVLHVHDELVNEGKLTEADLEIFRNIMNKAPEWAVDFPLTADVWLGTRYQK